MTTPKDLLGKLHEAVTDEFLDRIKNGEVEVMKDGEVVRRRCAPATLSAAVKFLKDNGIDATPDSSDAFAKLIEAVEAQTADGAHLKRDEYN